MELKRLKLSIKILTQIEALDAEIIEIDKVALSIIDGNFTCNFALNIKDKSEKTIKVSAPHELTELTELHQRMIERMAGPRFSFMVGGMDVEKNNKQLSQNLNEKETLQILGVLLGSKQRKREILLNQLNTLGVKIK